MPETKRMDNKLKIIISGGGTGGHIFPAVSIANAVKTLRPDADILFVGALGRMEMERVPQAGYDIVGLPVRGLIRPLWSPKNIGVLLDFMKSKRMVRKTIKDFKPGAAVGVGGYASAATLKAAHAMGIPCLIQEQNSYAGVTNKMLAAGADSICVAYDGMERFFPAAKIVRTGNPLRGSFSTGGTARAEALSYYGFTDRLPVVLVVGGSLGTRTLNEMMKEWIVRQGGEAPVQVIWQTGRYYECEMRGFLEAHPTRNIWQGAFIDRMDYAYAAADIVISRSGACTVSELCLVGRPVIFVPSPNVAEDHQTHNAMALVDKGAALMVRDAEAVGRCMDRAVEALSDPAALGALGEAIARLAQPAAADAIADEIIGLIG